MMTTPATTKPTTRHQKQKRRVVVSTAATAAATGASILVVLLSGGSGLSISRSTIGVEGFHPLSIPNGSSCSRIVVARSHDVNQERSSMPPSRPLLSSSKTTTSCLWSSIGGGNDPPRPPPSNNNGGNGDDDGLGDFLDPQRLEESESLKRAREYMSETSLPISFDEKNTDKNSDDQGHGGTGSNNIDDNGTLTPSSSPINSATSSALFGTDGSSMMQAGTNNETSNNSDLLAKNPYMQVVSQISPSELISKFTATANPRVQDAVRTTILGLIGSLPKLAFETTSITTGYVL